MGTEGNFSDPVILKQVQDDDVFNVSLAA